MTALPCEIVIPTTRPPKPEGKYYQFPRSTFIERFFVNYCTFDLKSIPYRFEFGYGSLHSLQVLFQSLGTKDNRTLVKMSFANQPYGRKRCGMLAHRVHGQSVAGM